MDYQFWVPLLATLVIGVLNGLGTYYAYRAVKIAEQQKGKKSVHQPSWFWRYGQFVVIVVAVAVVWIPYLLSSNASPQQLPYLMHWGPVQPSGIMPGPGGTFPTQALSLLKVNANGHALWPYRKYRIGAIAFHHFGLIDVDDVQTLQKSIAYDIRDDEEIEIMIPVDQVFRDEILHKGALGATNYSLVLLPKERTMDDFNTMRQAKAFGAIFVGTGAGPP